MTGSGVPLTLHDLGACFEGAVPASLATVGSDGEPNVTYLSKVSLVDGERVALSNQFFSKTVRNLATNPRTSLLVMDPNTCDQFRLTLAYERSERRGPVFERLRQDVDTVAALQGMRDVFKLRAADIHRVLDIERISAAVHHFGSSEPVGPVPPPSGADGERVAELAARLGRCQDLDTLVDATVAACSELFGYGHVQVLLLDETGTRLYTIASRGYDVEGVGSEVALGDGIVGIAAARCSPVRVGNVIQMAQLSRVVRSAYEGRGHVGPGREIDVPGLLHAKSRLAVPAVALGELVGVITVESEEPVAFAPSDEAVLYTAASLFANAICALRARGDHDETHPVDPDVGRATDRAASSTHVRFFDVDGSTFVDNDYLIKGVAGRILWSLLRQHAYDGRVDFTNREVRLDPSLALPTFRDNLEGRLILLKRRLDERNAPIRIEKTGRGRFRLAVDTTLHLEAGHTDP